MIKAKLAHGLIDPFCSNHCDANKEIKDKEIFNLAKERVRQIPKLIINIGTCKVAY